MFEEGRGFGLAVDLHTHDVWMKGAELAWRARDVTLGSTVEQRPLAALLGSAGFFCLKVNFFSR